MMMMVSRPSSSLRSALRSLRSNNNNKSNRSYSISRASSSFSTTGPVAPSSDNTSRPIPEFELAPNWSDDTLNTFVDQFEPFYRNKSPVLIRNYYDYDPTTDNDDDDDDMPPTKAESSSSSNNTSICQKWRDLNYLLSTVGPDHICSVEKGAYNTDGGERLEMPLEQYLTYLKLFEKQQHDDYSKKEHPLFYMAQNELPARLWNDIRIPPVISTSLDFSSPRNSGSAAAAAISNGKLYHTIWWVGPAGTQTPLHTDPLDNFLMQIVGRKHIMVLPAHVDRKALYVGPEYGQQVNTSAIVNPEQCDEFPLFEPVRQEYAMTGQLDPGDVLYIPSRWWHAVRSLDWSISVNTWWRQQHDEKRAARNT